MSETKDPQKEAEGCLEGCLGCGAIIVLLAFVLGLIAIIEKYGAIIVITLLIAGVIVLIRYFSAKPIAGGGGSSTKTKTTSVTKVQKSSTQPPDYDDDEEYYYYDDDEEGVWVDPVDLVENGEGFCLDGQGNQVSIEEGEGTIYFPGDGDRPVPSTLRVEVGMDGYGRMVEDEGGQTSYYEYDEEEGEWIEPNVL